MRSRRKHLRRTFPHQRFGSLHQRPRGVDNVVHDQRAPAANVSDQVHHFADVHIHAPFITIASGAPNRLANDRARSTPPASGDTTVKSGKCICRKYSTSTGEPYKWSTGTSKYP